MTQSWNMLLATICGLIGVFMIDFDAFQFLVIVFLEYIGLTLTDVIKILKNQKTG